jgi:proline iminopeptidase
VGLHRGAETISPRVVPSFVGALPSAERADALAAYIERLNDPDPGVHGPAANVWYTYERALSALDPRSVMLPRLDDQPARIPPTPITEAHYNSNSFFLKNDQLLTNANRLAGIPGVLVQGRYDLLCPPSSAHALCKPLHDCDLRFVEGAGHAISEPGILPELQAAIASFTARCRS